MVKVPRWEEAPTLEAALAAGPQESTRREHATLEAIAAAVAASGDPGLAAVAPVAYLPALNAVVTERLVAGPLRSRLGSWPGAEGRQVEVLRRTGRWLRLYHERVAGAASGRLDGAALAAELGGVGGGRGASPFAAALAPWPGRPGNGMGPRRWSGRGTATSTCPTCWSPPTAGWRGSTPTWSRDRSCRMRPSCSRICGCAGRGP